MGEVYDGIIVSVGKSWEPIAYSLQRIKPRFAVFLCTDDSCETVDKVLNEFPMPPSRYRIVEIPDSPESIGQMVLQCYSAYRWLEEEKKVRSEKILVDPTAGRKWMSSGVTMIASYLGVAMGYIDVAFKDGKPDPSTMKFVGLGNAYDQTGFLEIERGIQFFNARSWENAKNTFARIESHNSSMNDFASALAQYSELMRQWDQFNHYREDLSPRFKDASHKLRRVSFSDQALNRVVSVITEGVERLGSGAYRLNIEERPNLLLVVDLFLNAERCIQTGRFDDGVGRLYRALEALAQYYLWKDYGIDTSDPNFNEVEPVILERFRKAKREQLPKQMALEDDYLFLFCAKHDLLGKAVIKGINERDNRPKNVFTDLLRKRNNSIMAHGFEPVEEGLSKKLLSKIEELLMNAIGDQFSTLREELMFPQIPSVFVK